MYRGFRGKATVNHPFLLSSLSLLFMPFIHRFSPFLRSKGVFWGLFALGFIVLAWRFYGLLTHYQVDFSAYWSAGRAVLQGENPYSASELLIGSERFSHSQFLYSPLIALAFVPLALLDYPLAKMVWFFGQFLFLFITFFSLYRLAQRSWSERAKLLLFGLLGISFLFFPVEAELERGQVDLLTLVLIAFAFVRWRFGHTRWLSALALIGAGMIKPPILFLFLVPLLERDYRFIRAGVVSGIGLSLISILVLGPSLNQRYWFEYLPAISRTGGIPMENSSPSVLDQSTIVWHGQRFHTLQSFEEASVSLTSQIGRLTHASASGWGIIGFVGTAIVMAYLRYQSTHKQLETEERITLLWAGSMTAVLLFHPLTWIMNATWFLWIGGSLLAMMPKAWLYKYGWFFGLALILIGFPDGFIHLGVLVKLLAHRVVIGQAFFFALLLLTWYVFLRSLPSVSFMSSSTAKDSKPLRVAYLFAGSRAPALAVVQRGENHAGGFWGMYHLGESGVQGELLELEQTYPLWICKLIRRFVPAYWSHLFIFWRFFSYDLVFTSTAFGTQLFFALLPVGPKWVMHDFSITGLLGEEKTFQQKLFRFLVSRAAGIVTLSEKEAEKLQKRFPKLAEKITFIPFGVDLDFFKPSEVTEELRLIAIGTDPDRDYKTLFAACEGLNIPLTVTTRPNRLTAFNPLPAFVTVKSFSPRELVDAYNRSAIAIIPLDTSSRLNDAMGGSTVQESLAMGKAIIASHTFTMESYIFPEKNGLLVKERDVSQLRAAIQRLIADPVLRAHFGKNARTFAEDHLEIHACTKRLADFFKSL